MSHERHYGCGCACVLASTTTTVNGWMGSAKSGSRLRKEVGGGMRVRGQLALKRTPKSSDRAIFCIPPLVLSSCSLPLEEGSDTAAHLGCGRLRVGGGKLHGVMTQLGGESLVVLLFMRGQRAGHGLTAWYVKLVAHGRVHDRARKPLVRLRKRLRGPTAYHAAGVGDPRIDRGLIEQGGGAGEVRRRVLTRAGQKNKSMP